MCTTIWIYIYTLYIQYSTPSPFNLMVHWMFNVWKNCNTIHTLKSFINIIVRAFNILSKSLKINQWVFQLNIKHETFHEYIFLVSYTSLCSFKDIYYCMSIEGFKFSLYHLCIHNPTKTIIYQCFITFCPATHQGFDWSHLFLISLWIQ